MAQATFVHEGAAIDHTPGADVAPGDVVVQSDLVGIAKREIKANTLGALAVEGVFDVAKEAGAGVTFSTGDLAYWDDANDVALAGEDCVGELAHQSDTSPSIHEANPSLDEHLA